MAINQTVNIDVNANTSNAEKNVEKLENNIKTLDGAINVIGGSVEVLAGGLALTGAVTEEQAERFQTAAVGALAFADGTKRVFEGVKTLSEVQKVATTVQKAFGVATKIALGPIGLAIAAFGAITAAVVLLKDKLEIANKVFNFFSGLVNKVANALGLGASEAEKFREAQAALAEEQEFELELLEAQGASTEDLIKKERELLQTKLNATKEGTEERKEAERAITLFEAEQETARREARAEAAKKRREQLEKDTEAYLKVVEDVVKKNEETIDNIVDDLIFGSVKRVSEKLPELSLDGLEAIEDFYEEAEELDVKFDDSYRQRAEARKDFQKVFNEDLLDQTQAALGQLFGESKAVASANVLIDSAQAAVGIIKASKDFGAAAPAFQAVQFALLAATTIGALRQINQAEPGSTGTPSTPRPGTGGTPQFGIGTSTVGGATGTVVPSTQQAPPVRAYVLSGEVTSAQEADTLLQQRRQFP
jgi:hypothetical protein